ncbi:MAG: tetratricopeptide repeat protein [Alistipes sp.]|nr:tetratricopeptide repeat protein [Alistipes sp.]
MKKFILSVAALMCSVTLFAQSEIVTTFNEAVTAAKGKNYSEALDLFNKVIDEGIDSEDATVQGLVTKSKSLVSTCYQSMGTAAAAAGNYDEALANLQKAAETAELYDNARALTKAKQTIANVYQAQGADAFNAGDYATAIEVFSKGYEANPRNTDMALNLAESYFKSDRYQEGMAICADIEKLPEAKYAEAIAEAQAKMSLYTNNEVAKLQMANDYDGIIAMAEQLDNEALAKKIALQAYLGKKDYNKVIELAEAAAAVQPNDEERSDVYYLLGMAYNAKGNAPEKTIEAMKKVTAGDKVAVAQKAIADLSQNK